MSRLSETAIDTIAQMVQSKTGISCSARQSPYVRRRLRSALVDLGYSTLDEAADLVRDERFPEEHLAAVIRRITIGETWFYRDVQAMETLRSHLIPEMVRQRREEKKLRLRFWSAACASGAEAYTLSMIASEALPDRRTWDISVLATDINPDILEVARKARYGKRMLRTLPDVFLQRYFMESDGTFTLCEDISRLVSFRPLNLLSDPLPEVGAGFDIIFCANVLMYFDPDTSVTVLKRLKNVLAPDGVIVVSAVESSLTTAAGYERVTPHVCQIVRVRPPNADTGTPLRKPDRRVRARSSQRAPQVAAPTERTDTVPVQTPEVSVIMKRVVALLNEARLVKALALATEAVRQFPTDAGMHLLLSTVLDEVGETDAAKRSLKRVLYLQPHNIAAHLGLANMLNREGDTVGAERQYRAVADALSQVSEEDLIDPVHGFRTRDIRTVVTSALERRQDVTKQ